MRCQVCGRKLKKDGNICKTCYEELKKKKELKADNETEVFRVNRKYSPKFNLLKNGEMIILLVITILAAYSTYNVWISILVTLLALFFLGVLMYFNKRRALGTKTIFYQTKFRYKANYPFVNREEVIAYDDINDIAFFQTHSQRICKIGDIRFYTKGFLNGLTICDIPNIDENFQKIKDIINSTR